MRKLTIRGKYVHSGHFGDRLLCDIEFEVVCHFTTDLARQTKPPGSKTPWDFSRADVANAE